MVHDLLLKVLILGLRRQLSVQQQIRALQKATLLCKLLNRVTSVSEDSRFPVDVCDLRGDTSRVHVRLIQYTETLGRLILETLRGEEWGRDGFEGEGRDRVVRDRDGVGLASTVVDDCEGLVGVSGLTHL